MKSLVMWSGGTDSTALLKWLLENTDDEITAVHLYVPNCVQRHALEYNAVSLLYTELSKIRHFTLEVVNLLLPWYRRDADIQLSLLPSIIYGTECDRFFRGMCAEDWTADVAFRHKKYYTYMLNWFSPKWASIEEMSPDLIVKHWTKRELIEYLGDLSALTWGCLSPVDNEQCGVCRTCDLHKEKI